MVNKKVIVQLVENSQVKYQNKKQYAILDKNTNKQIVTGNIGFHESTEFSLHSSGEYYYSFLNEPYQGIIKVSNEDLRQEILFTVYINNDINNSIQILGDKKDYQIRGLTELNNKNENIPLYPTTYSDLITYRNELSKEVLVEEELENLTNVFLNKYKNSYSKINNITQHNTDSYAHKGIKNFVDTLISKHNINISSHPDIKKEIDNCSEFVKNFKNSYNYCVNQPGITTTYQENAERKEKIYLTTDANGKEIAKKILVGPIQKQNIIEYDTTLSTINSNNNMYIKNIKFGEDGWTQEITEIRNPSKKMETYGIIIDTNDSNNITYSYVKGARDKEIGWENWKNNTLFSEFKLCALDKQGKVAFYFDNNEVYEDARFDPNLHDLMVEIPKIGYKITELEPHRTLIEITEEKYKKGFYYFSHQYLDKKTNKIKSCDKIYISAFLGSVINEEIRSIPNSDISFLSNESYENLTIAKGENYDVLNYDILTLLQCFFLLIYQNEKPNNTLPSKRTTEQNQTNISEKGFCSSNSNKPIKFLGLEDFYGSAAQWVKEKEYRDIQYRKIKTKEVKKLNNIENSSQKRYLNIDDIMGDGFIDFRGTWRPYGKNSSSLSAMVNPLSVAGRFICYHEDTNKGAKLELVNKNCIQNIKYRIEDLDSNIIATGEIPAISYEGSKPIASSSIVYLSVSGFYKVYYISDSFDSEFYFSPEIIEVTETDIELNKTKQAQILGDFKNLGVKVHLYNTTNKKIVVTNSLLNQNEILNSIEILPLSEETISLQIPNIQYSLNIEQDKTNPIYQFEEGNESITISSEDINSKLNIYKTIINK